MSEIVKKLYAWCLNKVRFVSGAISAFLPRVLPNKKKSIAFLKRVFLFSAMLLLACPVIMRVGGGAATTGVPRINYTGICSINDEGDDNWNIKFITSGTLTVSRQISIDVFIVGGGGGGQGGGDDGRYGAGAGGGYTTIRTNLTLTPDIEYEIVVGAGGIGSATVSSNGTNGGTSSAFTFTAAGGQGGYSANPYYFHGGNGGSGGSSGGRTFSSTLAGGVNGNDGTTAGGYYQGGIGQHVTTYAFGDSSLTRYSDGGDGGNNTYTPQPANSGNGGNGKTDSLSGQDGASGIVIIRNARAA